MELFAFMFLLGVFFWSGVALYMRKKRVYEYHLDRRITHDVEIVDGKIIKMTPLYEEVDNGC